MKQIIELTKKQMIAAWWRVITSWTILLLLLLFLLLIIILRLVNGACLIITIIGLMGERTLIMCYLYMLYKGSTSSTQRCFSWNTTTAHYTTMQNEGRRRRNSTTAHFQRRAPTVIIWRHAASFIRGNLNFFVQETPLCTRGTDFLITFFLHLHSTLHY